MICTNIFSKTKLEMSDTNTISQLNEMISWTKLVKFTIFVKNKKLNLITIVASFNFLLLELGPNLKFKTVFGGVIACNDVLCWHYLKEIIATIFILFWESKKKQLEYDVLYSFLHQQISETSHTNLINWLNEMTWWTKPIDFAKFLVA